MQAPKQAVLIGATGAVGRNVLGAALASPYFSTATTLGRRPLQEGDPLSGSPKLKQHVVDLFDKSSYEPLVAKHDVAFCTLGVGEPSKVPREEFIRVDIDASFAFAEACRRQGVQHFSLMTSVGADPQSSFWYLRMKGELEQKVAGLGFVRCSFFRPSMLITPTNRYGFTQAVTLAVWPRIDWAFAGSLRKYRGIRVEELGRAMVRNAERSLDSASAKPVEYLEWPDFQELLAAPPPAPSP